MKELKDLAKGYRKLAAEAIYPGLPFPSYKRAPNSPLPENPSGQGSRAFATGNLLTKFITSPYNALENIARKTDKGYELVLEVGPKEAEYGRYVHYGTVKMLRRPFAEIAADDTATNGRFGQLLDNFMQAEMDSMVNKKMDTMEDFYKKAGWKIT